MLEVSPWVAVDSPHPVGVKRLFACLPLLDTSGTEVLILGQMISQQPCERDVIYCEHISDPLHLSKWIHSPVSALFHKST